MNNQIRLLRDEENNHDPLDLELTLDIGPRRDKRIKRSRSSWGREDEENVDRDQEVESATDDTGFSLSFFSSPPPARTGNGSIVLGVSMDKGKAHPTRTSTLDLTI